METRVRMAQRGSHPAVHPAVTVRRNKEARLGSTRVGGLKLCQIGRNVAKDIIHINDSNRSGVLKDRYVAEFAKGHDV